MGIAEDIMRGLEAAARGTRPDGFKAYQHIPTGVQGRPQYPSVNIDSLLDTYAKNELVYAAINRKATASVGVRLIVETRSSTKAEWEEEPGHPFRRLMMLPNPEMIESDFLRAVIVSSDVAGVIYAEKVIRNGLPEELHPLNPSFIAPIARPDGKVDYQYKEGSYTEIIPYERMLVRRKYDPRNKLQGLSPLAVALSSIDADNAQTDYIRAFFNNGGQPAGILKVKGTIGQAKADELRSKWRSRLGRLLGRQHDITVLDDNADYQKVGANLDEISSEAIRSFTESRLAMAFDVPPLIIYAYVGLLRATYDNLKGAWQGFWTSTLKPLYKDWSDFLTWRLLVDFEGPDRIHAELVRLRWDFSEVEWLRESKSETHDLAAKSLQVGGITLNEYRARIGEQPDPAGDYYLRGFNVIPVQVGTVPDQEPEPAPEPAATDEEGKSLERKSRLRALKKTGGKQTIERRIEKDMRAMLMKHYKKIAAAVAA